jgi:hypothetical protein
MDIDVHGGLTFSKRIKKGEDWVQDFTPGAWIGWDYAHAFDDIGIGSLRGKRWTKEEVIEDCKDVIDQLIDKYE